MAFGVVFKLRVCIHIKDTELRDSVWLVGSLNCYAFLALIKLFIIGTSTAGDCT